MTAVAARMGFLHCETCSLLNRASASSISSSGGPSGIASMVATTAASGTSLTGEDVGTAAASGEAAGVRELQATTNAVTQTCDANAVISS